MIKFMMSVNWCYEKTGYLSYAINRIKHGKGYPRLFPGTRDTTNAYRTYLVTCEIASKLKIREVNVTLNYLLVRLMNGRSVSFSEATLVFKLLESKEPYRTIFDHMLYCGDIRKQIVEFIEPPLLNSNGFDKWITEKDIKFREIYHISLN